MIWPFKRKKKAPAVMITWERDSSDEAYRLLQKKYPILDRHFELTEQLRNTYTPSSDTAVEKGIRICRDMIAISDRASAAWLDQERSRKSALEVLGHEPSGPAMLPNHAGYRQLAIILEKRGELEEAITVAKQAQRQGWNGDWEKRIARCQARIAKRDAKP